jgi:putative ABC transport system permease protein
MFRDMGCHKSQFISIFLMAFLAIFIYTGVGGEWRGLQKSVDEYYETSNLADIFVYGNNITKEQEMAVLNLEGVTDVARRMELSATILNEKTLYLYFVEDDNISKPYIAAGSTFDLNDTEGLWLDKRFADSNGIKVGDTINATVSGLKFSKTVRGLIYFPEQVYESGSDSMQPDFSKFGYAYLSYKAFPVPDYLTYSTLLIKGDVQEGAVAEALDNQYSVYLEKKDHASVSMFQNEVSQHKMMGDIFPVVFLLIALLTMMTTMTRLVSNQRIQIGTLKALGFKKGAITWHYVAYGFALSLFGAVLGLILGPLIIPRLFLPSMSSFYTIPKWQIASNEPVYYAVSIALVLLCTAVSFLACRRHLSETPADTLRPKAPKAIRHGLFERTRLWVKIGFNAQWNIRDATRNKIRSFMAIVGVFGCTTLIVCALSMNDAMNDLKKWQYETVNIYESKLQLDSTITDEQIQNIMTDVSGEAIIEESIEIRYKSNKKTGTLRVTDGTTLIVPTDYRMNPIILPTKGVSITGKVSEALGVKKGEVLEWHIYGDSDWHESVVSAIYREPVNQGITMNREQFEKYGFKWKPTAILSARTVSGKYDGVESITLTSESIKGWDELTEAVFIMVYLLIVAAAILSVVVLYNLGLLSFTEMERSLATLKVMGLKSGNLRNLLLTQNLWFSVIGFAFGIPGGLKLTEIICSYSGESFDFPISSHPRTLLISFVFTFGLSIIVNLMFSSKIRRLNMVEALKAME